MILFLTGALAMALAIAGVFFLRFWRDSRDRLFQLFAIAFFMLTVNRVGFALAGFYGLRGDALNCVRFLAFAVIPAAIVDKNRSRKISTSGTEH